MILKEIHCSDLTEHDRHAWDHERVNGNFRWECDGSPREAPPRGQFDNNKTEREMLIAAHLEEEKLTALPSGFGSSLRPDQLLVIPDMVNHPPHYNLHPSGIECIEITRHMPFNTGNVVKYLWREGMKGSSLEDLQKAAWYLNDEIEMRKKRDA